MSSVPVEEDVLDAFAAEASHDAETFQRYLKEYPQFAAALIDLSRELSREVAEDEPLSDREIAWIDEATRNYSGKTAAAPFAAPTVEQQRAAAQELRVPRQVITMIIECKVAIETISLRTRRRLALRFNATVDGLVQSLSGPRMSTSRSYKADINPSTGDKISLEQALREAKVSEEIIADLVSKDE
jgi:predicted kinase